MQYLISEGYPSAAQKFAHEANIQPEIDIEPIQDRVAIREAIHSGDIQSAIEKINEFDPEVSLRTLLRLGHHWRSAKYLAMIRHCSCTTHRLFGVLMRK